MSPATGSVARRFRWGRWLGTQAGIIPRCVLLKGAPGMVDEVVDRTAIGACVMGRLLIVDDAPLFRAAIGSALSDAGFEVVGEGTTARDAVERAEELQPDVVLLDIVMPGGSGLDVVADILHVSRRGRRRPRRWKHTKSASSPTGGPVSPNTSRP